MMNNIVVAKFYRLGKNGDKFDKKLKAQILRTDAKLDRDYIEQFNKNYKTSGRLYEIDEKATHERNESLNVDNDFSGKKNVADTIAEINAVEALEDLMPYEDDAREGVVKALESKKDELLNQ